MKLQEHEATVRKKHEEVSKLFEDIRLPAPMRNEYRIKTEQYDNMLKSLEMMKTTMSDPAAATALEQHQMKIYEEWIVFEEDMEKKTYYIQ